MMRPTGHLGTTLAFGPSPKRCALLCLALRCCAHLCFCPRAIVAFHVVLVRRQSRAIGVVIDNILIIVFAMET